MNSSTAVVQASGCSQNVMWPTGSQRSSADGTAAASRRDSAGRVRMSCSPPITQVGTPIRVSRSRSSPEAVKVRHGRAQELLDRIRVLFQVIGGEAEQRQLVQQVPSRAATGEFNPVVEKPAEPQVSLAPRVAQDEAIDIIGIGQRPFLAYRTAHRGPDGGDVTKSQRRDQLVGVLRHLRRGVRAGGYRTVSDSAIVERDYAVRAS
jgi:hypothetical protein